MRLDSGLWAVILITAFIIFLNLGGIPLLDPDEPVYAETPKEMILFNDFISPRIYGEYWYDKPPMYYWLVAGTYKLFGINEFTTRLPAAISAILCVVVIYIYGRKFFSERAGIISALILATSIEYFYVGKAAVTDMTLTLFFTISLLSFLDKKYYMFYIFAGLATLTKGPIGFLFTGAIAFVYLLVTRNFSEIKKMKLVTGSVVFLIIALPWYLFMYQFHGNEFIDKFFGFHNLTRFTSPEHPEGVLWYYYFAIFLLGFFPWITVLVQASWRSFTKSRDKFFRLLFLNIWAAFIFGFFTISQTKLPTYILPIFPPLAMVCGWYIDHILSEYRRNSNRTWSILLLGLTSLLITGMIYGLQYMPELRTGVLVSAAVLGAMGIAAAICIWKQHILYAVAIKVTGMVVFSAILVTMLIPAAAPRFTSDDIAKEFTRYYDGHSPVYVVKFLRPGFSFYTNVYGQNVEAQDQIIQAVNLSGKMYFVLRQPEYDRLPEKERNMLTVLSAKDEKLLLLKQK